MTKSWIAGLALALALSAATAIADPVADAQFVTAVDICVNFGADGWFATDRLEGAGWCGAYDAYYNTTVYTSSSGQVIAIPPPEGGEFPARCSVISGTVKRDFGESAVLSVLDNANLSGSLNLINDCRMYWTPLNQEIYILSDGNEDLCNDPDTARVEVVFYTDPIGGQ